jgi:hypothetical protein
VLHNLRSAPDAVAWEACQAPPALQGPEGECLLPDRARRQGPVVRQGNLPHMSREHVVAFRELQPSYWDEEVRRVGVTMTPRADRHRWSGSTTWRGSTGTASSTRCWLARARRGSAPGKRRGPRPGLPAGRRRPRRRLRGVSRRPAAAAAQVHPGGDVTLALSDEAARRGV